MLLEPLVLVRLLYEISIHYVMREIDYDEAWEVVSDDTDMLVEQVCEGYEQEVMEYLGLDKYIIVYDILMDYFDELSEESRTEIDKKLKELGL